MPARLEYRHNNATDTIILVDDHNKVRSEWPVDASILQQFCNCAFDAEDWDDQGGLETGPNDYGQLLAIRKGYTLLQRSDQWDVRINFILRD